MELLLTLTPLGTYSENFFAHYTKYHFVTGP